MHRIRIVAAFVALAVSAFIVLGLDVHGALAATTWEHSKSKVATNLDSDLISTVTLSIPTADEQLTTEVCFVLDKSQFSATKEPALQLLSALKDAAEQNGAKVKVDIIGFNRAVAFAETYDLSTQYDQIVEAFNTEAHGGTNMHAGLLKAQEVLASDTSIPNSRKYMILVSDGDTYLYCKNGDYTTPYSRSYGPIESAASAAYGGFYADWLYNASSMDGNVSRPTTSSSAEWEAYFEDVVARNEESGGDQYDFIWYYYDHNWTSLTTDEVLADGFLMQPRVVRSASNTDMALYYAASTYHELASMYHCYAVAAQSLASSDLGKEGFMDYLNDGASTGFDDIENQILYLLGAGSTVDDYMGYVEGDYNFDLVNPADMTITVDSSDGSTVTYSAVMIEENHYGFGPQLSDGTYSYEVTYVPGDKGADEHITWKTNVNVSNFTHVQLHYKVKLTNPADEPGTYGVYDADGSQGETGLYTNSNAILHPVASDGTAGEDEDFSKPTVSYTMYQVTYTDGVDDAEIFADQSFVVLANSATPAFDGTPTREGYTFKGWDPSVTDTVTGTVTYTAIWEKDVSQSTDSESTDSGSTDSGSTDSGSTDSGSTDSSKDTSSDVIPKTGDDSLSASPTLILATALFLGGSVFFRRRSARIE
jgi:LPXTG-motif cell wall-anchored protein